MGSIFGFISAVVYAVVIFIFITVAVAVGVYFGNKWTKNGLPVIFQMLEGKQVNNKKVK